MAKVKPGLSWSFAARFIENILADDSGDWEGLGLVAVDACSGTLVLPQQQAAVFRPRLLYPIKGEPESRVSSSPPMTSARPTLKRASYAR